jgi:hypothetical protein
MEDWIDLGVQARNEAQANAVEKTIGLAIEKIKGLLKTDLIVSEKTRDAYRQWFNQSGKAFPVEVRRGIEQRISNLRAGRDIIEMLTYIYDQHSRAYIMADALQKGTNREAVGQGTVGVLKLTLALSQTNFEVKFLVDLVELLIDDTYGWLARYITENRVQEIIILQDQQLDIVNRLGRNYIKDVNVLKSLLSAKECHSEAR